MQNTRASVEDIEKVTNFPAVNDNWEQVIKQMVEEKCKTEEAFKEYMKEKLDPQEEASTQQPKSDKEKHAFGRLVNESFARFADQLNLEDFTNASTKLANVFMGTDFLFHKNELFTSTLDREVFEEVNDFTAQDMFFVLNDKCCSRTKAELGRLKKWRLTLVNKLLASPFFVDKESQLAEEDRSVTARTKRFKIENDKLKGQILKLEKLICKQEQIYETNKRFLNEFRASFDSLRGSFERPNIDISAKIRLFPDHDKERLEKLLFNAKDHKDMMVAISQNNIEAMIIEEIALRFKQAGLKVLARCMQLLPNSIYLKHLSQSSEKLFTRFDSNAAQVRLDSPNKDVVFSLDAPQASAELPHPYIKNFYQTILTGSNQSSKFLKFVFAEKRLGNLTISRESLMVFLNSTRGDEHGIAAVFKPLLGLSAKTERYFKENPNYPHFILEIIYDSMCCFDPGLFTPTIKMNTDATEPTTHQPTVNLTGFILHNPVVLQYWYSLLTSPEKLDLFNHKVSQIFLRHVEKQVEFMEFRDYNNGSKIYDINNITAGLIRRDKHGNHSLSILSFIENNEKIRIKHAFWVKEGLVFKVSQKKPDEHMTSILLRDQMKHPQLETWISLVLNNDPLAINYDLTKFTDVLTEMLDLRLENLQTEQKLSSLTLNSYVKLLMLRSRGACLRLISYMNFYRSTQKRINLQFLDLCEQDKTMRGVFESESVKTSRKDDFLRQTNQYSKKEYEELRKIFDEEQSVCSRILPSNRSSRTPSAIIASRPSSTA